MEKVYGARIDNGDVWGLHHFIPHTLSMDGFVFVRKQRILTELNTVRYDKVNFLFSLGEMPEWHEVFPALDSDRELFEWLRDEQKLVILFLPRRSRSVIWLIEGVGDKTCGIRLLSYELVLSEDLTERAYANINVVIVGTELLKMFDKFIEATEQV